MFKANDKNKNQKQTKNETEGAASSTFNLTMGIQEANQLTAIPSHDYEFELYDADDVKLDDAWMARQCESIPIETLDETSGAYLDHDIVAAMKRALDKLDMQRNGYQGHVPLITETEKRENKAVQDINRAVEDQLIRLEEAKKRTQQILSK